MPLSKQDAESARNWMAREIAACFHTRDEVLEQAAFMFRRRFRARQIRRWLAGLYDELAAERDAEMRSWPATTDCDRLDAAFDDLNSRGIMARHNWLCCQPCGHGAMTNEAQRIRALDPGATVRGYTFYHEQGTEGAATGAGLGLAYGAIGDEADDTASVAIGHDVVQTLATHGLRSEWDGSIDRCIFVVLEWKRRSKPTRWCEEQDDPSGLLQ